MQLNDSYRRIARSGPRQIIVHRIASLLAWLLSTCLCVTGAVAKPLFESDESLSIVLEAPLTDLLRQADRKPTVSGKLRFQRDDGSDVTLDVDVSTRGRSRLEQCEFPPLTVNLKRRQVGSTLFAGQNKLKLVTQCRDRPVYRRYVNQEYAIYKVYNLLSDYSLRARMLDVTYRDSDRRRKDKVQPAFFIESTKGAAERLGMQIVEADFIAPEQFAPMQLSILTLFQFMIGNTDWSVRKGRAEAACCHNGKVLAPADSNSGWVVLPYDFDLAGLINAKYAAPSEKLRIKSVRHRLYRGFCRSNEYLDMTIGLFNVNRAAIEALFQDGPDGRSKNKSALKYLRRFYEIINNEERRQKEIFDDCRGSKAS